MGAFGKEAIERQDKLVKQLDQLLKDTDNTVEFFGSQKGEKWEEFFAKFDSFLQMWVQTEKQLEKAKAQREKDEKRAKQEIAMKEQAAAKKAAAEAKAAQKEAAQKAAEEKANQAKQLQAELKAQMAAGRPVLGGAEPAPAPTTEPTEAPAAQTPKRVNESRKDTHALVPPKAHILVPPPRAHRSKSIVAKMFDTLKRGQRKVETKPT